MTQFLSKTISILLGIIFLLAAFGWLSMNVMFAIAVMRTLFKGIFG